MLFLHIIIPDNVPGIFVLLKPSVKFDCKFFRYIITFSILNENGDVLKSGLNGSDNDISDIKENVIRLSATLNIKEEVEGDPVLRSWEISWGEENKPPEFIDSSFRPGVEGWINPQTEKISIKARDKGGDDDVISGLDTNSAKFYLEYIKDGEPESP